MTYYAIIHNGKRGNYTASVFGIPGCTAEGATKEEALGRLQEALAHHLADAEVVPLEMEKPQIEHPWSKFAGMFEDDPLFDEVIANIETYRRELDAREADS